jgi:hypothetical protein
MAKKTLSVPVRVIVEDHPETRFRELCMIVEDRVLKFGLSQWI